MKYKIEINQEAKKLNQIASDLQRMKKDLSYLIGNIQMISQFAPYMLRYVKIHCRMLASNKRPHLGGGLRNQSINNYKLANP